MQRRRLGNARHDARSQPTHTGIVSLASASERMGLCDVAGDDEEGAKWIARTDGSGGIRPHGEASRDPRKSVHKPSSVRGRLSSRRRSRAAKLAGRVGRLPAESSMRRRWQWEKVARALGEESVSYSGGGELRPGRDALSVDLKGEASRRLGGIGGGGEGNHRRGRGHKPHLAASNTETRGVEVGRAGHGRRYLGRTRCLR
ncbi:hypothetical protein FB107DRAFT_253790 [Schizophyllum commune]